MAASAFVARRMFREVALMVGMVGMAGTLCLFATLRSEIWGL
jgi:hypothetical protein